MTAAKVLETVSLILYVLSLVTFWLYRRHPLYGGTILLASMAFDILIGKTTLVMYNRRAVLLNINSLQYYHFHLGRLIDIF